MSPQERNALLKAFYNALPLRDTTNLANPRDRDKYVEGLHRSEARDPVEELARSIDFNESAASYLFTGNRGCGKTIELKNLARRLEQEFRCVVFFVDAIDYINDTEPVSVGDLLAVLMGALSEAYDSRYRDNPLKESYWERFRSFLQSKVEIESATLGTGIPSLGKDQVAKADIKFALKSNPTFKQHVQAILDRSLEEFVRQTREFADAVVVAVREREARADCKVVLIVDSLEQLRAAGENAPAVYESLVRTFHGNADNLRFNTLHTVYSVPPYLPLLAPGIAGLYSGGFCGLPQVKVYETPPHLVDRSTGQTASVRQPNNAGLDLMREVVKRRFARWEEVFAAEHLDRPALASGGNLRIFFSLIQRVLVKAANAALPIQGSSILESAENDLRAEMPLSAEDRSWLARVAASNDMGLEKNADLPSLVRLFEHHLILDYRNGVPWFDPLPLVWDSLPKVQTPGS